MAKLFVTEYAGSGLADKLSGNLPPGANAQAPLATEPAATDQVVTFTTATASNAFGSTTRVVRIVADTDCHVQFGAAPVATTEMQPLTAGIEYWRAVVPGHKVSAVEAV